MGGSASSMRFPSTAWKTNYRVCSQAELELLYRQSLSQAGFLSAHSRATFQGGKVEFDPKSLPSLNKGKSKYET